MSLKLSQTVIMSDVDGTLLHTGADHTSPRNLEALTRYTDKGGRLGIATGRSIQFIRHLVEALPVNYPCITYNGGAIYDFQKEAYLAQIFLSEDIPAQEYAKEIRGVFPDCGVVFVSPTGYFDIDGLAHSTLAHYYPNPLLQDSGFGQLNAGPFYKAVFLLPPERCKLIYEYVQTRAFAGVRFVFSDNYMLEMLPDVSSKGAAMAKLSEMTGIPREKMIAIGDYFNDFEMIEYAGIGVTLSDAPEEIREIAQMIVCPCAQDALANLVELLENKYEY